MSKSIDITNTVLKVVRYHSYSSDTYTSRHDMDMITIATSINNTKLRNKDEAETVVVVTVVRVVVVTIRDTAVPRIVVPTTTTKDAVRACCSCRQTFLSQPLCISFQSI